MKTLVKTSVVAIALLGSTLSASAGVTGSDPRPTGPHTANVWSSILSYFGFVSR